MEQTHAYKIFVGKPERMGQLGRHERRYEYNIRMDLKRTLGWCGMDSSDSG
jgi:hypothetical protein